MILSRLAEAARSPSWFTVVVELGIVVVGIFLGLQADAWNTARAGRAEESRYLRQLAVDVEIMRTDIVTAIEDRGRLREAMLTAIIALQAGDTGPDAWAAMRVALLGYQTGGPFRYRASTYDEMVATGALARLGDATLKAAIASTFAHLAIVNANVSEFRISLPVVDAVVWSRVSYGMLRGDDGRPSTQVRFELSDLVGDLEFQNALVEMADVQVDAIGEYLRAQPLVEDLWRRLAERNGTSRETIDSVVDPVP